MAITQTLFRESPPKRMSGHRRALFTLASLAVMLSFTGQISAQQADGESESRDRYRVELLLFTLKQPADPEYMAQAEAPQIPPGAEMLHGQLPTADNKPAEPLPGATGLTAGSNNAPPPVAPFSKTLLGTDDLQLTAARNRLRASGRYDIVLFAAWNEAFPPGHKTPPLLVHAGASKNGYSEIEGFIQIERQRYLHVTAQLYHLNLNPSLDVNQPSSTAVPAEQSAGTAVRSISSDLQQTIPGGVFEPEVKTWLRETRRMRSEEVHFMDSPTMGLLVYFEPLD